MNNKVGQSDGSESSRLLKSPPPPEENISLNLPNSLKDLNNDSQKAQEQSGTVLSAKEKDFYEIKSGTAGLADLKKAKICKDTYYDEKAELKRRLADLKSLEEFDTSSAGQIESQISELNTAFFKQYLSLLGADNIKENRNPEALFKLAELYSSDDEKNKDSEIVKQMVSEIVNQIKELAKSKSDPGALRYLALIYQRGIGRTKLEDEAAEKSQRKAEINESVRLLELAEKIESGNQISKKNSKSSAFSIVKTSSNVNRFENKVHFQNFVLYKAALKEGSPQLAQQYLLEAAHDGHVEACYLLSEQKTFSPEVARHYRKMAAERGHPMANYAMFNEAQSAMTIEGDEEAIKYLFAYVFERMPEEHELADWYNRIESVHTSDPENIRAQRALGLANYYEFDPEHNDQNLSIQLFQKASNGGDKISGQFFEIISKQQAEEG